MRITKVIREFMEEQLTDKRLAANKEARAEYESKRKACIAEIEETLSLCREQVAMTLAKHGMDATVKQYGDPRCAAEVVVTFLPTYVKNDSEDGKLQQEERARYEAQKKALKEIELELALGGDKEALMRMLNEVQF